MRITPILLILIAVFTTCKKAQQNEYEAVETEVAQPVEVETDSALELFGASLNSYIHSIDTAVIPKNVFLNSLFQNYQVSDPTLHSAITEASELFSFKKLRSGLTYNIIYHSTDSGKVADYFIYHHQPSQKLVLQLTDTVRAYWHSMPIDTLLRTLYAKIDRTLYHSIIEANVSYYLGLKLSDVFAWQIDFFRIDKNDFLKVIFEEHQVAGKAFDIGQIQAAMFFHRGDTFYAFNFEQDSVHNYFDKEGKSLRKQFLKAPLRYSRISSRYTRRRFHPVQLRWKAHLGTDYAARRGTPIRSVGDGTIIASAYSRGNGNYVKVKHNATYTTQYLHMSRRAKTSKVGRRVGQGDIIGYVGNTGLATGPHLCFRFWKNGVQVDPFTIKIPPSTPIKDNLKAEFDVYKTLYLEQLAKIKLHST